MSKELDELLRKSTQKVITGASDIEEAIIDFLSVKIESLRKNEYGQKCIEHLRNDFQNGFGEGMDDTFLSEDSFNEFRVRDLLKAFSNEDHYEYFSPPSKEFVPARDPHCAGTSTYHHCFVLSKILINGIRPDMHIGRFLDIGFEALKEYVRFTDALAVLQNNGSEARQNAILLIREYLSETCKTEITGETTIRDIMEKCIQAAQGQWFCGVEPIEVFAAKVTGAYSVLSTIFMDMITQEFIIKRGFIYGADLNPLGMVREDNETTKEQTKGAEPGKDKSNG